ncbi:CBS domain-containing protein CBSX5-like [Carya illinoinensis]|uniref:CBS domain-containing protein CBSX5-like n=1 Tax=Carya illinoinensis TaxID=32201 RepID=UPI001C726F0A|nr:CBS domain-containing protein CBSX5-like [Carya illinoinensis]
MFTIPRHRFLDPASAAEPILSDPCLGKPALRSLPISATVADAFAALKNTDDNFISVWDCVDHSAKVEFGHDNVGVGCECRCVGKVCMVDVICYLCRDENLFSPSATLKAPVSASSKNVNLLWEAIDLILPGAQNLVVPIQTKLSSYSRRKQLQKPSTTGPTTIHNGREFCWLTQEDVIRFLLGSIGLFSPLPALSVDTLGIITTDILAIDYYSPASSAIGAISRSLCEQTSVADSVFVYL